ncbi:hypothetical protein GOP47_0027319 [Adiantum capillus-veneris]|nr:hypothetical protein GOP47_0027319 [Adiantum capillus-veneris]
MRDAGSYEQDLTSHLQTCRLGKQPHKEVNTEINKSGTGFADKLGRHTSTLCVVNRQATPTPSHLQSSAQLLND